MKLEIINKLVIICITGSLLGACQKEADFQEDSNNPGNGNNGGTNGQLTGDWNFVNQGGLINTSATFSESGQQVKVVAFSDYVSTNNTGTLKVTANQFVFSGIGYTVNDEVNIKMYLNGFLLSNADSAFDYVTPPINDTIDYVRNSDDSLTFSSSIFTNPDPVGGGMTPTGPIGARFNISGDTLSVTIKNSLDTTITQAGSPANLNAQYESTMRFTRQ